MGEQAEVMRMFQRSSSSGVSDAWRDERANVARRSPLGQGMPGSDISAALRKVCPLKLQGFIDEFHNSPSALPTTL